MYFDRVPSAPGQLVDAEVIESVRVRARLRHAHRRLNRLEEVRDVALLRRGEVPDSEISELLGLAQREIRDSVKLLQAWVTAGCDPSERTAEEMVLIALIDQTTADVDALARLVDDTAPLTAGNSKGLSRSAEAMTSALAKVTMWVRILPLIRNREGGTFVTREQVMDIQSAVQDFVNAASK